MNCGCRTMVAACVLFCAHTANAERATLIVADSVVVVDSLRVLPDTDSLFFHEQRLAPGVDYTLGGAPLTLRYFRYQSGQTDTLELRYRRWPSWLTRQWGNPAPEPVASSHQIATPSIPPTMQLPGENSGSIQISGAKTFRVTSGSGVGSAFGQSLDVGISGELSPGVRLEGAVSDRGYDPINGYANSRLDEFDRLRLRMSSARFVGQAGDISLVALSPLTRTRDVSGGSAKLSYPGFTVFGVASRPRGKFQSAKLSGIDGFQGPYQPTGSLVAIVPGSDEVWLDGRKMERGPDKDYTVDYPSGRITFGVTRPIDSRSRIEIDYEPGGTAYRQELLLGGAEVRSRDSSRSLAFAFTREGDDKDRPLFELSNEQIATLTQGNDSEIAVSGVVADTNGAWRVLSDSLPDTVWLYVGVGNGDFAVRFSYVGSGQGAYQYLGNDQYQFVGTDKGDYNPIVLLQPARRVESARAMARFPLLPKGSASADVRFSKRSFNLWNPSGGSSDGSYHNLSLKQAWSWHGRESQVGLSREYLDSRYSSLDRIDQPDLLRTFLAPVPLQWNGHRLRHTADLAFAILPTLTVSPSYSRASFGSSFTSESYGSEITYSPVQQLKLLGNWRETDASLHAQSGDKQGNGRTVTGRADYSIGRMGATTEFEYDRRTHDYADTSNGTKYLRGNLALRADQSSVSYEGYREDSLVQNWRRNLTRHRVGLSSGKSLGNWRVDGTVTHQWLDYSDRAERSFLGRLLIGLNDQRRHLGMSGSYLLSDERRNARGYTYLQVDPGRGNFRYENGRYIADPFGDYIRLEEILSDIQRVRRGEKTFRLDKQARIYQLSAGSKISEELLADGSRPWWWVVPFLPGDAGRYLSYERRYDGDLRVIPWNGLYAISMSISQSNESRLVAQQDRKRTDFRMRATLRQPYENWILEQGGERFNSGRDQFFGDAGKSSGWRGFVGAKGSFDASGLAIEAGIRSATGNSDNSNEQEKSRQFAIKSGGRISFEKRGEIRLDTELYRQTLTSEAGVASTLLTDDHEGNRGLLWTFTVNYGFSRAVKLSVALNGRYSDNRSGRLFARSEMKAEF